MFEYKPYMLEQGEVIFRSIRSGDKIGTEFLYKLDEGADGICGDCEGHTVPLREFSDI